MSALAERLLALHDALTEANLPHAFGGAIALGFCTLEPRATRDLDVNVFVGPDRTTEVFAALPDGIELTALSTSQAERDGQIRLLWEGAPIDLFFSVHRFHDEVAMSVRQVPFMARTIPVLGCTQLAVFKALGNRTQDWADIEAMARSRVLDLRQAADWVRDIEGETSTSVRRLLTTRP